MTDAGSWPSYSSPCEPNGSGELIIIIIIKVIMMIIISMFLEDIIFSLNVSLPYDPETGKCRHYYQTY